MFRDLRCLFIEAFFGCSCALVFRGSEEPTACMTLLFFTIILDIGVQCESFLGAMEMELDGLFLDNFHFNGRRSLVLFFLVLWTSNGTVLRGVFIQPLVGTNYHILLLCICHTFLLFLIRVLRLGLVITTYCRTPCRRLVGW